MASPGTKQLNVTGHLKLTVNGRTSSAKADGSTIRVSTPDDDALQQLIRGLPKSLAKRRGLAYQARLLARTGLRLSLLDDQGMLIELGAGVRTSWPAGLLGLQSVNVSTRTLWRLYKLRR